MLTIWIVLGVLAVLIIATMVDNRRRRSVREATLPPGISRSARREVLCDQRAQDRKAQAKYEAEHPYMNNGSGGDGGGI
jgi:hypothetical protein